MKKIVTGFIVSFLYAQINFSQVFDFYRTDSITVIDNILGNHDTLKLAWSGGLSQSEFSSIDLNLDGTLDLFVFDRVGDRFGLFKNIGIPNTLDYKNFLTGYEAFPVINDWALLEDYDGDGLSDIFHYWNGGISVYKNISVPGTIQFSLTKSQLHSNYQPTDLILYVSPADIPSIADVDLDGDLDILTYGFSTGCMEYHKNLSMETYGNADSLIFVRQTDNWGIFTEGVSLYDITLTDSCDTGRHSGSTSMAIDMDGDLDKDLVLGGAGGLNLAYVRNGGSTAFAQADFVDPAFPQNNTSTIPVNFSMFPAAYYLDVNNDGKKDLIVGNNAPGTSETEKSIWRYKNIGTSSVPDFVFQENNFLQNEMIEVGEGAYPALFDYDRDGLMDLAIGNALYFAGPGKIAVLRNIGTSSTPVFEMIDKDMSSISTQNIKNITPTFGDMDGDGDVDMVVGETTGYIHYCENTAPVLPNTPAQFVLTTTQYFNIKENSFSAPFIIDLNLDGKNDIVCGGRLGKLNYYENTGTVTVPNFSSTPTIANLGAVSTVDLNFSSSGYSVPWFFISNGKLELFMGSYSGKIYHYTDIYDISNNINPVFTFESGVVAYFKDGTRCAVTVGDFNNDIYPDLIYGNLGGGVDLLFGRHANIGIEELTDPEQEFIIYPNPSQDQSIIYIQSKKEFNFPFDISIYDLSGRVVKNIKEINLQQGVDVHELSGGLYIVELRYNNFLVSKLKFIKS